MGYVEYSLPNLKELRELLDIPTEAAEPKIEVAEVKKVEEAEVEESEVERAEVEQIKVEIVAEPEAEKKALPKPKATKPMLSGTTLANMLNEATYGVEQKSTEEQSANTNITIDPETESKLREAKEQILNLIKMRRPRFVAPFEGMTLKGNAIEVEVGTEDLQREILHDERAMLRQFADIAGVNGAIELKIVVNEEVRAARPIKLEDRVEYMAQRNPLLAELRQKLDLEFE